jgi:hypothetical protein
MTQNNGFPEHILHRLRNKLTAKKEGTTQTQTTQQHNKKCVTFTYHSPATRKVTNLFKRTNLKIDFRPTNTVNQQLSQKPNNTNPSGICQLKCYTRNNAYVGKSDRPITTRYREHLHYIGNKNPLQHTLCTYWIIDMNLAQVRKRYNC